MNLFDKFSEGAKNITEGAKFLSKKSGEILETTKIKLEILKLEREIDNNFQAIGNLVYRNYLGHTIQNSEEEITRLCLAIRDLEKDILAFRDEIDGNRSYSQVCQYCRQNMPSDANFCPSCGNSTDNSNKEFVE